MTDAPSKLHEIVLGAHDIAESTRTGYLRDLNQWIEFAGTEPANWTRRQAQAFYSELLRRMKPQSANRLMAGVQYASRWWAHLENNPALDFALVPKAKAKDKKSQRALDEAGARRLLATCDDGPLGLRDFALTVVGLETGMRCMSLASMMIEDTLFDGCVRWPYPAAFVALKGRDPGWVPLSDTALRALQPWLRLLAGQAHHEGPIFRPLRRRGRAAYTLEGKQLSRSAIAKMFAERAAAAGLEHFHPHILRHTFVTWRADQKLQPHEIAAITHHDLSKSLGALGGYMDARALGGQVRNATPDWLAELVRDKVR